MIVHLASEPHELKKMSGPTGPGLWTLHQKTVTTHRADDKVCGQGFFKVQEGAITLSWNAPPRTFECSHFEFISALEGMSEPAQ